MKRISLIFLIVIAISSCGQKKAQKTDSEVTSQISLKVPNPPAIMDQEQKLAFLKVHFWDNFDFEDEKYPFLLDSAQVQSLFKDYASLLMSDPYDTLSTASLMDKASGSQSAFALFSKLSESFFHDPNSPYRNDEFFIPVLKAQLNSSFLNDDEKIRPAGLLKLAQLNRLGRKANDFQYTTENLDRAELIRAADETADSQSAAALSAAGKSIHPGAATTRSLYKTDADYILVFFNNPGCHMCREISENLQNSSLICDMVKDGSLLILAVYPDEDLDAWRAYHPHMPSEWINSHNPGSKIMKESIYNLNAIPALYLLDKGKTVLAKDETDVYKLEIILADSLSATQDQQAR